MRGSWTKSLILGYHPLFLKKIKHMTFWVSLHTPFGPEALVVRHMKGMEELSEPFDLTLTCTSDQEALDPQSILYQPVILSLRGESAPRHWHGVVVEFIQGLPWKEAIGGISGLSPQNVTFYTLRVRPQLWLLTLSRRCEIFQNKTAMDIIKEVLQTHGVTDISDQTLSAGQRMREYCVQYNESAFDFVSRLMEEEGIYYFFNHSDSAHTLVLADQASAYGMCEPAALSYDGRRAPQEALHTFRHCTWHHTAITRAYKTVDYDFQAPSASLVVTSEQGGAGGRLYEYPGLYEHRSDGEKLADARRQQLGCLEKTLQGSGTGYSLTPGHRFTLQDHPQHALNQEYAVVRVQHTLVTSSHENQPQYENTFTAIPSDVVFRPARKTPKPRIYGTQTAVVTGTPGEEIYMDAWGRIKVHFHWDQKNGFDEQSSCWIRVAQTWSGPQWGGQYIPRVGQEVVVTYLEGDPDRPLVTGTVYNGTNPIPYGPDEKTKSTLKSNSYKGGGGFNEIRFEDHKGMQEVYIRAERHHNTLVRRGNRTALLLAAEDEKVKDELTIVKGDRITTYQEGDETHTLTKGNQTITLTEGHQDIALTKGNQTITLTEGNQTTTLTKGNQSTTLTEGNQETTLSKGNQTTHLAQGERHTQVQGGDETHDNEKNFSHTVQQNYTLTVQGDLTIDVTGKVLFKAGKTIEFNSGDKTTLTTGTDYQIQVGANHMLNVASNAQLQIGALFQAQSGSAVIIQSGAGMLLNAAANFLANGGGVSLLKGGGGVIVSGPAIIIGG